MAEWLFDMTRRDDDDPFRTDAMQEPDGDVVQSFALTVIDGPDAGMQKTSAGIVTVGTHESSGLTLQDATVSRFHCEIAITDGRARVRDLGSLNGTVVDGVGVVEAFLRDGATITLGRTRLRFDIAPDRVRVATAREERFGGMIGRSVAMRRVFAVLKHAAASDATVLIGGETGTGKEAAAEALHRESARAERPFMVVDCASIPHDLLESELFGHEKGAFTGAVSAREGVFEAAHGGTVFLDEIGELGPDLQPKLLRVLERRELKRVGSNQRVQVDVRVVAATNRDLRSEVNARRFRSDLYYRLAVIEVTLPPLRSRADDLPLLVDHFLGSIGASDSPAARVVRSPAFLAGLAQHTWPGNVRELRNYVERAVALHALEPHEGEPATGTDPVGLDRPLKEAREEWVARFERIYLEAILERHEGNVTAAARAAGMDRVHFYRLLWRHKLR
jgi:transcriptional regulator with GAF, ATPase, and Fis domain